jgi:hypothetical protein
MEDTISLLKLLTVHMAVIQVDQTTKITSDQEQQDITEEDIKTNQILLVLYLEMDFQDSSETFLYYNDFQFFY